jgi:hypothetical protein
MSKRYKNGGRGNSLPSVIIPKHIIPMKNDTVALVGTHDITRKKAPFSNPNIDIWVFNGQATMDWCLRADVVFDIHPSEDIYRRSQEDGSFGKWLKETSTPFYTPHPYPECKSNIVYPVEEVTNNLLKNFVRNDKPNPYYTSGPCYALAMAIHKGYKRIQMFGIEMENNTEYVYQRDGVALWLGIAAGRGITVEIDNQSMMFNSPLYGYEMDASKVDREAFEQRASELEHLMEKTHAEYSVARGVLDAIQVEFMEAQAKGIPQNELMKIVEKNENAMHAYEQSIANHAFINGQYIDCRTWQTRVEKAMEFSGKAQEILGMRNEKWDRMTDKIELTGKVLPNE